MLDLLERMGRNDRTTTHGIRAAFKTRLTWRARSLSASASRNSCSFDVMDLLPEIDSTVLAKLRCLPVQGHSNHDDNLHVG